MSIKGIDPRRTVGILVADLFEDLEFWSVAMRVREAGYRVLVIGTKAGVNYTSKSGGLAATSEVASSDVVAADLHALLVPGGFAPDRMRRDQEMLRLVREMDSAGKVLGFICHAGWVAASAKIIGQRKVTGSLGIKDDMENAGGIWMDEPAFIDGNRVWGKLVDDIPEYQRQLIKALGAP